MEVPTTPIVMPPSPHPDFLRVPIPDLTRLSADDPVRKFSHSYRASKLAAERNPEDAEWRCRSAEFDLMCGRLDLAVSHAEAAIRLGLIASRNDLVARGWTVQSETQLHRGAYRLARQAVAQMAAYGHENSGPLLRALRDEAEAYFRYVTEQYRVDKPLSPEKLFLRAFRLYREAGDWRSEIRVLVRLSRLMGAIGDPGRTLEYADMALRRSRDLEDWTYVADILTSAALITSDVGYRLHVTELFHLAIRWGTFTGSRFNRLEALEGLGRRLAILMKRGATNEADWRSAPIQRAVDEWEEMGLVNRTAPGRHLLAFVAEKAGNTEEAMRQRTREEAVLQQMRQAEQKPVEVSPEERLVEWNHTDNQLMQESIQSNPDPTFIFKPLRRTDGAITDFVAQYRNPAAEQFFDEPSPFVWMLNELESNPAFANLAESIHKAIVQQVSHQDEIALQDANGNPAWWNRRVVPSAHGVLVSFRNVTEARRLVIQNNRIQEANTAGGVGVWEYNVAEASFIWDERMHEMYGIPDGMFSGRAEEWLGLLHPEDAEDVEREWFRGIAERRYLEQEFRILRRDGQTRVMRMQAYVFSDEHGTPLRVTGTTLDITRHRRITEELFAEKERLRVTLHSIGDAVICTDAEMRVTFMNVMGEQMTGWSASAAIGHPVDEIFRIEEEGTGAAVENPVGRCLATRKPIYVDSGIVLVARDGRRYDVQDSVSPIQAEDGEIIGAVLVFQDVTKARALRRELEYSATHDALTGLINRTEFVARFRKACEDVRDGRRSHSLCMLDLDRFKAVNDQAGHAAGDALLREVADSFRRNCRSKDLIARMGGDEFAILLLDCKVNEAQRVVENLVEAVGRLRFLWDGKVFEIGASAGLVAVDANSPRPTDVLGNADIACRNAKSQGRNRMVAFTDHVSVEWAPARQMGTAEDIRTAISEGRLQLWCQEVRSLRPNFQRHFELLLRMKDEQGNLVAPSAFLPAAERHDLIGTLDRWVVRTALRDFGARLRRADDVVISINVSSGSLSESELWADFEEEIMTSCISPTRVHFEISESALINNYTAVSAFISAAHNCGCHVTLDDFGLGLSTFEHMKHLKVNGLKIDENFVRRMATNEVDRVIVRSVNEIAHQIGVTTIAKSVEDEDSLEAVRVAGTDYAQGRFISAPVPFEEIFTETAVRL